MMSGASWFLPRLIGFGKATDLIMTGRHLDAKEALEIGLINKIYPATDFEVQAMKYVQNLASLPTRTIGYNKTRLNYSLVNDLAPSMQNEFNLTVRNMGTRDYSEGITSFREKRKAIFKGK
jgi:2-(1,2-epoxy-1,2-dihydrophenyl)acetyl-CoA isomerase